MLRTKPSLEAVKHEVRRRICATCRRRSADVARRNANSPRSCEATCPVFAHLPMLRKTALLIDPMLRSRKEVLRGRINRVRKRGDRVLGVHADELVNLITELIGEF